MPSIARYERSALSDLLEQLGPGAATLCEGWDTRALAAHLLARERRPDAAVGVAVRPLAGHLARVQAGYAARPYADLVAMVRSGPPRTSFFALPGVDRLFNSTEFFVHHEDVRRAQPGWSPRELPDKVEDALWEAVRARARFALRHMACGVRLSRPGGDSVTAKAGEPVATLTGQPQELLLYLFGRGDHARVSRTGSPEALAALDRTSLAV